MTSDRTGVLIIRAWIEQGSSEPLRAEVRVTSDGPEGIDRTLILARPEQVIATVQEWLDDILREA